MNNSLLQRFLVAALLLLFLLPPAFSLGQKDSRNQAEITGKNQSSLQTNPAEKPRRILSLVPSTTEIIFALDAQDRLVARTDFCTWPPETKAIPSVGGFDGKTISLERIVAYQPDLVCMADVMHNHLVQPLEELGIQVFLTASQTLEEIRQEIISLGAVLGQQQEAKALAERIDSQLEEARAIVSARNTAENSAGSSIGNSAGNSAGRFGRKVYWEVSTAPYFTPGKDSFITDLLAAMGLENIFAALPQAYPQVSEEGIIARQPDFIFFPDYNLQGQEGVKAIANRPGWQKLPAVARGNIFPVESDLFSRPGARVGEMALELARLIAGQQAASGAAE